MAGVQLSQVEREIIGLNVVSSSLKEMVNYRLLRLYGSGSDVEVQFHNSECQQLFSIFFADFLENVASALTGGASINCLQLLQKICEDPQLNEDKTIEFLQ